MTVKQALSKYYEIEAELLLCHILNITTEQLYTDLSLELSGTQLSNFELLANRRIKKEPIAYILGYKYFHCHKFLVDETVLIPRPESEWIVDYAKKYLENIEQSKNSPINILEIGTGSGCISISIQLGVSNLNLNITATDISEKALKIAEQNNSIHKTGINFLNSDMFTNISGKYDLIISNLPYVPLNDYQTVQENLKFEPRLAITTEDENWQIFDRFFKDLPHFLNNKFAIFLEIDPKQETMLSKLKSEHLHGANIHFFEDDNKLLRYCVILSLSSSG